MGNVIVTTEAISMEGKSSFAMDTSYWVELWDQYTNEISEVVIHCWKEEEEVIEELSPKSSFC